MKVYFNNYLKYIDQYRIILLYGDDYDKYKQVINNLKKKYQTVINIYQNNNYYEIFEQTYRQQGLFALSKPLLQLENITNPNALEKIITNYISLIKPLLIINALEINSKNLKNLFNNPAILYLPLYQLHKPNLEQNNIQLIRFHNYQLITQDPPTENLSWLLGWNLRTEFDSLFNNLDCDLLPAIYKYYQHPSN